MNQEEMLKFYRKLLVSIDQSLMETIKLRLEIAKSLGEFKKNHQLPVIQPEAALQVYTRWEDFAESQQLPKTLGSHFAKALMDASEYVQSNKMA